MFEISKNTEAKNSTFNSSGRYVLGGDTTVNTSFVKWWEKRIFTKDATDIFYVIENKFDARPDLIANAFYEDPTMWWFICQYNAILDPETEIIEGVTLRLPTPSRIQQYKNGRVIGGIA